MNSFIALDADSVIVNIAAQIERSIIEVTLESRRFVRLIRNGSKFHLVPCGINQQVRVRPTTARATYKNGKSEAGSRGLFGFVIPLVDVRREKNGTSARPSTIGQRKQWDGEILHTRAPSRSCHLKVQSWKRPATQRNAFALSSPYEYRPIHD